jgi:hypothetical protein
VIVRSKRIGYMEALVNDIAVSSGGIPVQLVDLPWTRHMSSQELA